MKLVGLSGNHARPSRTRVLVEAAARAAQELGAQVEVHDLQDIGSDLGRTFTRAEASEGHGKLWDALLACDGLIVGSPVYKASYSGLLKHVFDLLDMEALRGKPVLLAATGRAPAHALMIDHQFRPLFAFFGALTVPTGLYATDTDFAAPDRLTEAFSDKVARAAAELVGLVERP